MIPRPVKPAVPAFAVERSEMPGRVEAPAPRPGVSTTRRVAAVLIVAAAATCVPEAVGPGFNGADLVCVAAPVLLDLTLRRRKSPGGGACLPLPPGSLPTG